MKFLITTHYGGLLVQVGRLAVSVGKNYPCYEKRFGLRVLRPFLEHGAGIHLWGMLVHFHTNRKPLYGQP